MDSKEVGILEKSHEVCLSTLLQSRQRVFGHLLVLTALGCDGHQSFLFRSAQPVGKCYFREDNLAGRTENVAEKWLGRAQIQDKAAEII